MKTKKTETEKKAWVIIDSIRYVAIPRKTGGYDDFISIRLRSPHKERLQAEGFTLGLAQLVQKPEQ